MKKGFENFEQVKVLVIGDIMLDEYLEGKIVGVSPEAPIPKFQIENIKYYLGGAANVANNITALGARCALVGVVCCHSAGKIVKEYLACCGIQDYTATTSNQSTTKKSRLINDGHQYMRFDKDFQPFTKEVNSELVAQLEEVFENDFFPDIVIVSDYAKHVLTFQLIEAINYRKGYENDWNIILDPKPENKELYHHLDFDIMTPNLKEAMAISGISNSRSQKEKVKILTEMYPACKSILLTLGEFGMYSSGIKDISSQYISALNRNPVDVTGAGDSQIAAFAVVLAAGWSMKSAVEFSNVCASISVGKYGTSVVSQKEAEKKWKEYL